MKERTKDWALGLFNIKKLGRKEGANKQRLSSSSQERRKARKSVRYTGSQERKILQGESELLHEKLQIGQTR